MILTNTREARDRHKTRASHTGCKEGGAPTETKDLIANLNHELRTPLTTIRAFSSILLDEPDMELTRRRQFLAIVVEEAERLTAVVNRLLSD
jgi:signal transduction histidine kinase